VRGGVRLEGEVASRTRSSMPCFVVRLTSGSAFGRGMKPWVMLPYALRIVSQSL
jgi:hypothetical protein